MGPGSQHKKSGSMVEEYLDQEDITNEPKANSSRQQLTKNGQSSQNKSQPINIGNPEAAADSDDNYEEEFDDDIRIVSPQAEQVEKIRELADNYAIEESKNDDDDAMDMESDRDEDEYEDDNYEEDAFDDMGVNKVSPEEHIKSNQFKSVGSSQTANKSYNNKNSAPMFLNDVRSAS